MLIVSEFWTKLFSFGKAHAVTIYPFIFLKKRQLLDDQTLINHERIHLRQALELGILFFYIWYLIEFGIRMLRYRNFRKAYLMISFEQEAYLHEQDSHYLDRRRYWQFWRYISK
ncbi:hypothetical protein [Sphingobacterium sp. SYP-B4668]|uniref:hypothetical protein n=1 Tax=Sphingobacterium sp. SYP-B4668 TaxID=2996035 RepID=UPI0022DD94F0|nr:hypothetical protein [Sphingobacterium sp. SYP-B4668]